jgi:hypothetical protein
MPLLGGEMIAVLNDEAQLGIIEQGKIYGGLGVKRSHEHIGAAAGNLADAGAQNKGQQAWAKHAV